MHDQAGFGVRLDWGPTGGTAIVPGCDHAVVVDVLSFTTTLTVAVDRGVTVVPCPWSWRDDRAVTVAREHDATLAVGRSVAGPGQVSLSPGTVRAAGCLERLVLPSPNGSTISARLAEHGVRVVGASLRNRRAVAAWLAGHAGPVAVVAAGERWPDGSLRPAIEDLWGAGAVIDALVAAGATDLSPEAWSAAAAFRAITDPPTGLPTALHGCAGGVELADLGYGDDVDVAAEIDASPSVPVLGAEGFTDGHRTVDSTGAGSHASASRA